MKNGRLNDNWNKVNTKEELNQKIKECFTYHSSLKTNVKLDINMYPNRLED